MPTPKNKAPPRGQADEALNEQSTYSTSTPPTQPEIDPCERFAQIPEELKRREQWLVWCLEQRGDKYTKVPYAPQTGQLASSTNSDTWGSFEEATDRCAAVPSYDGVGFVFTKADPYVGIDFDQCRDPQTGEIVGEVAALVAQLGSYTEVSQSGTGIHLIGKGALPGKGRRTSLGCGDVEVYDSGRYFVMTGNHLPTSPSTVVELGEKLPKLLRELFPDTSKRSPRAEASAGRPDGTLTSADKRLIESACQGRGSRRFKKLWSGDRSDYASASEADAALLGLLCRLTRGDKDRSFRIFGASGLYRPKWDRPDYRDATWELVSQSAKKAECELSAAVAELNQTFAVATVGSKVAILKEGIDPVTGRPSLSYLNERDFLLLLRPKNVEVPDADGKVRLVPMGETWLRHPERRQYDGIVFDPTNTAPGSFYNLWRGFSVQPEAGDWSLMHRHIRDVICCGNDLLLEYLLHWMARIVQDPGGVRPGVAIALIGRQGAGKGLFIDAFAQIFGPHFFQCAGQEQIMGKHNTVLENCLLLFADEAFFAGCKKDIGKLKALITEQTYRVEPKFVDAFTIQNHVNLIMASNNDWVAPVAEDDRRFLVLRVSAARFGDRAYFDAVLRERENGGVAAMLHDLLAMDLSGVDLRNIPSTDERTHQKLLSLDAVAAWWYEGLCFNTIQFDELEGGARISEPMDGATIEKQRLYGSFREHCRRNRVNHISCVETWSKQTLQLCPELRTTRPAARHAGAKRPPCFQLPPLKDARESFAKWLGDPVDWKSWSDDTPSAQGQIVNWSCATGGRSNAI